MFDNKELRMWENKVDLIRVLVHELLLKYLAIVCFV